MIVLRTSLAAILVLWLAGCAVVSPVEPGRVDIAGEYTVQTPIEWARITLGGRNTWTVDGPSLQSLNFVTALEDGDTIYPDQDPAKAPKFRETMGPLEIIDLFQASIAAYNETGFEVRNFRPARFGTKPGFRFEFSYMTREGLAMNGFANGALIEKKLYMIIYIGTQLHYFGKHRDDAEKIVSSIVFS